MLAYIDGKRLNSNIEGICTVDKVAVYLKMPVGQCSSY